MAAQGVVGCWLVLRRDRMDRTPILFVRLASWTDDEDDDLPRRGYGFRAGMTEQELRDRVSAVAAPIRAEL